MNLKERAKDLKTNIPAVFMALKYRKTPSIAKIFAALTIAYTLSPIDLIPDFIPVIGLLDDLILLPMMIALTIKFIPKEIFEQCKLDAQNLWENSRQKKWYFAIPIVLFWIVIFLFIYKQLT